MGILIIILKIVGILLLVLLGIALFLLACFLFHPFFYRVRGEVEEVNKFDAKVFWFFHLISATALYFQDVITLKIRIAGILIYSEVLDGSNSESERFYETDLNLSESPEVDNDSESNDLQKNTQNKKIRENKKSKKSKKNNKKNKKKKAKKKKSTKRTESAKHVVEMIQMFLHEIGDESNKAALIHVLKEVKYLFLHFILPRKLAADIRFSTNDPSVTGQITAFLSVLPFIYQKQIRVIPDFENMNYQFKGRFQIGGRFTIIYLLISIIRLLLDKNIRRIIRRVQKTGGYR
ncbi:MAG: DUF2953 domain-containing protein [Lachnospiraceae bacterium]